MRLVNWNIERNGPQTREAVSLLEEIRALSPDLVCLTEAWTTSLDTFGGHTLSAKGVAWGRQAEDERKVVLWSPRPWIDIDTMEEVCRFGGAVSGRTELGGQLVRIVGICIPYHMASPFGQVPKEAPWRQHELFLGALDLFLRRLGKSEPVIVLGDFNRKIPRAGRTPRKSFEMLEDAFRGYEIATTGVLEPLESQTVDHAAFAGAFDIMGVKGRPATTPEGLVRSDHFGVVVDFDWAV